MKSYPCCIQVLRGTWLQASLLQSFWRLLEKPISLKTHKPLTQGYLLTAYVKRNTLKTLQYLKKTHLLTWKEISQHWPRENSEDKACFTHAKGFLMVFSLFLQSRFWRPKMTSMYLGNQQCVRVPLPPLCPAFLGYVSFLFYAHDSFYIPSSFLLKFKNLLHQLTWGVVTQAQGVPLC